MNGGKLHRGRRASYFVGDAGVPRRSPHLFNGGAFLNDFADERVPIQRQVFTTDDQLEGERGTRAGHTVLGVILDGHGMGPERYILLHNIHGEETRLGVGIRRLLFGF